MSTAAVLGGVQNRVDYQGEHDSAEFDLWALVREELATNPDPRPEVVADAVFDALPEDQIANVARLGLVRLVRAYARLSYERKGDPAQTSGPPSSPRWDAVARLQRRLHDRLQVGEHVWLFLADCTREHLLHAASIRRDHAAACIAKADELERIADALTEHGASIVSELPQDVLAEVLS